MQDCFSSFPYVHLLPRGGQDLMSIFRRRCHSHTACLAGWSGIFSCFRVFFVHREMERLHSQLLVKLFASSKPVLTQKAAHQDVSTHQIALLGQLGPLPPSGSVQEDKALRGSLTSCMKRNIPCSHLWPQGSCHSCPVLGLCYFM